MQAAGHFLGHRTPPLGRRPRFEGTVSSDLTFGIQIERCVRRASSSVPLTRASQVQVRSPNCTTPEKEGLTSCPSREQRKQHV